MRDSNSNEQPRFGPIESEEAWVAEGWATEPTELTAARQLGMTLTIRFTPEESALLRTAFGATGESRIEFVRHAALAAARQVERALDQDRPTALSKP